MKMIKKNPLAIINTDYINNLGKPKDEKIRSKINRFIPDDAKIKLYNISSDYTIVDCNEKADMIADIMEPLGFQEIGTGTNRIAFMKDGYVYKVALDDRGFIDNMSEYKRSVEFPQYFAKVYETNRTVLVCEYCELISEEEFRSRKDEIKSILTFLSGYYVMDDVGLTTKNYCNWGIRQTMDGSNGALVIIDNAYFYPIRNNTNMMTCSCGYSIMPNSMFTGYQCSNSGCGMHYTVEELLNKSGVDFDNEDTQVIKAMNHGKDDGNSKCITVTGNDSGEMSIIDPSDTETIAKIESAYKMASEVGFTPNSMSPFDAFGDDEDDSGLPSKHDYVKLNAEFIGRKNEKIEKGE